MTGHSPDAPTPYGLRCEHLAEPLGIDEGSPLLSWRLASARRGDAPASCRVLVRDEAGLPVWDTGEIDAPDAAAVRYAGAPLRPRARYRWQVTVTAGDGASAEASSWFETGRLGAADWRASWIAHDPDDLDVIDAPEEGELALADHGLSPAVRLRRPFEAPAAPPVRARLYITARGLYEMRLNGRRVGDHELTPGWTDYRDRIDYQTHDVTELVVAGENVLAATLADGWWSGFVGFDPRRLGAHYGNHPQLLAELHIDHADGRHEVIATDTTWRTRRSPLRYADLLKGECLDLRRETPGWDRPSFADEDWAPARITGTDHHLLTASVAPPIRAVRELAPRAVTRVGADRHLVDFGQNFAGRVRLTVRDLAFGARVVIRHGEVLDEDGALYTDNLRTADATDVVIGGEDGGELVFEPRFTYHGFRYAEVVGLPALEAADITGVVLHNDTPWTGEFACSDPDLERLHANIGWGQRSNFLSVPTDCPQRDERLGWLADAQVFLPTACLNADVAAFFEGWLREVRGAQSPDGCFTNVAPRLAGVADQGAPGWGDAGVLLPWHLYRTYGDERFLERNFDAMCAWVDFVHRHNPDLVWRDRVGPHYADWLAPVPTPREVVAGAYFARSTDLTARAARVLGRDDAAARYEALAARVRETFTDRFVSPDGTIEGDTQTGYLLALAFGLLPDDLAARAAERLAALVEAAGPGPTTGFLGVGLLAPVLDECGRPDLAHALLRRTDAPSWLYPLRHGATTVWERWDGYTPERGFQAPAMNSFNHYALGSVGAWLYEGVAGLAQAPGSTGYRELLIRPRPGGLAWARAAYESVRGPVRVGWRRADGELRLEVSVPPSATATVHVPTGDPESVRESGSPVADAAGVTVLGTGPGTLRCRVVSGDYRFTADDPSGPVP
ncbi:glycoside hydrolase family 78 protein [Actinomadura algeriensis]|uniref:alpha-L-rhamnosidase n=1 Tax=Actinomadura algeriensis TaxID=1679523 RepID=A0ABR9JJA1_9ACTN|nr:glycoside hydrolase family 78 protein [Actinomadura algeriensis]MBE1530631.1 alpha-L-rhamnosidase [Actinomadura algeriensis]